MNSSESYRVSSFRTIRWVGCLLIAGVLQAACSGSSASNPPAQPSSGSKVAIVQDGAFGTFAPATLEVAKGATVVFVNESDFPHNVIFADDSLPDSAVFQKGEQVSVLFSTSGTFTYVCSLHPGMQGTVLVS
jgi:plastocyanin